MMEFWIDTALMIFGAIVVYLVGRHLLIKLIRPNSKIWALLLVAFIVVFAWLAFWVQHDVGHTVAIMSLKWGVFGLVFFAYYQIKQFNNN